MARRRFTAKPRVGRPVLLLSAVIVLAMPVSYTGGRSVSHPHAFVQLFFDAARGSTNHHGAEIVHGHAEPIPREYFIAEVPDDTPVVTPTGGSSERVALVGMAISGGRFLVLAGLPTIDTTRRRLLGRLVRLDIPPPRLTLG